VYVNIALSVQKYMYIRHLDVAPFGILISWRNWQMYAHYMYYMINETTQSSEFSVFIHSLIIKHL